MWSRFASAAARAARACPTAAVSSRAESSATTSPARTRSPLRTLMAASWPPTSGATRTSVVRTTPTIGAAASDRHRTYPPAPAATRTRPSAIMTLRLAMAAPPLDDERRQHRQREISSGEQPQTAPVVCHLPEARAELVDAHHAVDREIRREDGAGGEHRLGNCFARPGESGQKKLRQAGAEEDQRWRFRMCEPGPGRLAHEAGRENEQRCERDQLQGMAESRKAIDAR